MKRRRSQSAFPVEGAVPAGSWKGPRRPKGRAERARPRGREAAGKGPAELPDHAWQSDLLSTDLASARLERLQTFRVSRVGQEK